MDMNWIEINSKTKEGIFAKQSVNLARVVRISRAASGNALLWSVDDEGRSFPYVTDEPYESVSYRVRNLTRFYSVASSRITIALTRSRRNASSARTTR